MSSYNEEEDEIDNEIEEIDLGSKARMIIKDLKQKLKTEKEKEVSVLITEIKSLKQELTKSYNTISNNEGKIKLLEGKIKEKDEEIHKLNKNLNQELVNREKLKIDFDLKYTKDVTQAKYIHDGDIAKVEFANKIEKINEDFYSLILEYEKIIENFTADERKRNDIRKIEWQNKMNEMKKCMINYVSNGINTNVEDRQGELNKKLNIIHSDQLIKELENQSVQVEDLIKQREHLDQLLMQMRNDINVHVKVEKVLAEKNKKYVEMIHILNNKISNMQENKSEETEREHERDKNKLSIIVNSSINDSLRKYNLTRNNSNSDILPSLTKDTKESTETYNKILYLQKQLISKSKENENLRLSNETLKAKINYTEEKYSNIIENLDYVLEKIYNSPDFKGIKDLYVNLDEFKKCDFNKMTPEQKYSVTIMIIKYLQPLVYKSLDEQYNNIKSINGIKTKFCFGNEDGVSTTRSLSISENTKSSFNMTNKKFKFKPFFDINYYMKTQKKFDFRLPKTAIPPEGYEYDKNKLNVNLLNRMKSYEKILNNKNK